MAQWLLGATDVKAFFAAVAEGNEAVVQQGIALGLVNARGDGPSQQSGYSALHWAAEVLKPEMVRLLLAGGADVDATDNYGHTPLHCATSGINYSPEIVRMLLGAGANVRAASHNGYTALYGAARAVEEPTEVVEILLNAGANVRAAVDDGTTPLHQAMFSDNPDVVKVLLTAGPDLEAVDENGETALAYAVLEWEHPEIVKILLDAGADPRYECITDEALSLRSREVEDMIRGAREEWTRPFLLQVSATCDGELTFHTMGGNVAATTTWPSERPVEELPARVLEALRSSGFQAPFQPVRVSNLRLLLPNGKVLDVNPSAGSLWEQMVSN